MADTEVKDNAAAPNVEVASGSQPANKVDLDLDDAPFLKEPEEEKPKEAPAEEKPAEEVPKQDSSDDDKKKRRKKMMILAGGGAGLLVIIGVVVWFFFFRTPPPPPPEDPGPEIITVPSKPQVQTKPDFVKEFEPFLVAHADQSGKVRFLVCKFSVLTKAPNLSREIDHKMIPLRDAVFFYLRSKNSAFLMDSRNGKEIKADLVRVLQEYLTQGTVEDVLFESYLNE